MQEYIERATDGEDLSFADAHAASTAVFEGASDAQIGGLLTALRTKGETETEIAGFAAGMAEAARTIDPNCRPVVDTCGTGGDAHDTINVSTTSAVVAAGAGVNVAKHGNYSVSSSSGSADVFDELGVTIDAEPREVERSIENCGIGFMLAPVFHPAMKAVIGPRKELEIRTIFNVLGPLTNPAGADAQVVGVYDPDLVVVLARALAQLDVERALVVHGSGMDEICVHGETVVAEVRSEQIEEYTLSPADLGLGTHELSGVAGGTPAENARDLEGIVTGDIGGAKRDIVLANAGAAIYVAGAADSLTEGVKRARETIDAGHAADKLVSIRTVDEAVAGETA